MARPISCDKERIKLNIACLKKGGENFEVDVDPDLALASKAGKEVDVKDIVKSEKVFSDVMKGQLASETIMKEVFGTSDPLEVAKAIISEGRIQLTADYRHKMMEGKRKRVIDIIHRNGIDPRTNAPIPVTRIESAFHEAKISLEEHKTADDQVNDILKKLMPIIPIRFETKTINVHVPSKYANSVQGVLKQVGKIIKMDWLNDGSLDAKIEIPGGLLEEFSDKINKATHGSADYKEE